MPACFGITRTTHSQLRMSQEYDENESSFDEFCCEQGTEGHCDSQFFTVLSANNVLDLMKNKTEQVREVVNVSILTFWKF